MLQETADELLTTPEMALAGAVLAACGIAFAPVTLHVVRKIYPGRNVFFARWGFMHLLMALVVYLVVLLLFSGGLSGLEAEQRESLPVLLGGTAFTFLVVCGFIALWAHRLDPAGIRCLGFPKGGHLRATAAGMAGFLLTVPCIYGLGLAWPWLVSEISGSYAPQDAVLSFPELSGAPLYFCVVLAVVVVPFFEELIFRGFLQPLLVQNFHDRGGVVLTALIFSMLHGVGAFLPLFCLSLVLGGVMLRTQRLTAVWAIHALFNGIQVYMLLQAPTPS